MEHTSDRPLVSAIVPAYNAAAYIEQTLHSLVTQSYPNLEIIVVDDGSTDGTVQRVEAMARKHSQIRMIRQANLGVAAARNRGIEESRGEFIAPVDADDIWFPEAVTKLVNCFLSSDSRTGVAYGWSVIIDENGLLDGRFRCSTIEGNVLGTLICHNFLGNASATMIRRACFEKVEGYDGRFRTEILQYMHYMHALSQ
jgi:glycosyltransferase involved in cell wall biosynthesis